MLQTRNGCGGIRVAMHDGGVFGSGRENFKEMAALTVAAVAAIAWGCIQKQMCAQGAGLTCSVLASMASLVFRLGLRLVLWYCGIENDFNLVFRVVLLALV